MFPLSHLVILWQSRHLQIDEATIRKWEVTVNEEPANENSQLMRNPTNEEQLRQMSEAANRIGKLNATSENSFS